MAYHMSPLSDIEAHCTIDKEKMDSEHEHMDKLAPEKGAADVSPVVVAAVILLVIALVVVVVVFLALPSERSPTDVYRQYVDASNDRDIKRMFDQTVTQFTPDYEQRLENLSSIVFLLDPEIKILDLGVTYRANMSGVQVLTAQVIADDVESKLSVVVDDFCYVHYSVNVTYRDISQSVKFDGEMLCVKIDNRWLLVVPGYF